MLVLFSKILEVGCLMDWDGICEGEIDRGIDGASFEELRGVEVIRYWRNRIGICVGYRGIERDYMGWNMDGMYLRDKWACN